MINDEILLVLFRERISFPVSYIEDFLGCKYSEKEITRALNFLEKNGLIKQNNNKWFITEKGMKIGIKRCWKRRN